MGYASLVEQRAYQRGWAAGRRKLFFEDKQCERCGSTDDLNLHHRDAAEKVANAIWNWGRARRLDEIAKCEIVCLDCHKAEHRPEQRERAHMRPRLGNGRFAREAA